MAYQNKTKAIPMTNIASTALEVTYLPINATGIPNTCNYLVLINNSSGTVTISFDGVQDNYFLLADSINNVPIGQMNLPNNQAGTWPQGTIVYAKGTAGMSGNIYLCGFYLPVSN